jgi:2-polyprenyl-3-methyl-5-hydroxy-6-metoxy-1,4-benzoquinol methylase
LVRLLERLEEVEYINSSRAVWQQPNRSWLVGMGRRPDNRTVMRAKSHWESVYRTRAPEEASWYRPHLDTSLALIEQLALSHSAAIIDVGAGASTLTDDLVRRGCANVTVLDISETALRVAK